ncbi:mucin-2-like isoform X2 [Lytechinus pictus]|uniref:mucin-2-like isoform X2 n=1 Tax=Lytechinus pictus TaxID=7653 RepID=UPI0030B9ADA9
MNFLDNVRHRLISGFIFVGCAVICCQCSCVQTSHLWEAPTCENAVQNIDDAVFRLVPKRQFLSSANIGCTRHSIVVCRIPDCLPDPCFHGNCMETLEGFSCRCQNDWTGDLCDIEVPTPITEVTNLTTTPEVGLSTLTPRDREETSSQFTMTIDRVVEGSGASKASLVTTAAEATVYRGEVGASVSPQEDLPTTAAVTNDAIDPSTTKSVDGADPGETTTSEAVTSQETSSPPSSPRSTSDVITTTASQKSENCSLDSEVPTPITKVTNLSTKPEVSLSTLTPRGREENSSQFTMTIDRVEAGSGASEASLVTTAAEATVYRGEVGASASPQESSSLATTAAVTNDAIVPSTTESVDGADPGETTTSEAVTSQETSAPPSSPPSTSDVITTTASQKSENCSLDSVHTPITEVTNLSTTPEVSLSTLTPRDREENSSQFTMTIDRVEEGSGASEASLVTTAAEATVYRGEVGASASPQESSSLATTAAVTNDAIVPSTTESVDGADPGETTTSEAVTSQETSAPPSSPPSTSDVITTTASQKSENCSLDSVSSCPTGWITESGEINKCYKLIETKAISWAASSLACCELSSSLLVIDSSDEVEFIEENFGSEGNVDTWLGCLESDNGLWSCTNSASTWVRDGDQSGYWHWGEGWPEEDTTGRRCVFIELSDDHDSDWKDTDCNASYRAICQKVLSPALTSKDRKG